MTKSIDEVSIMKINGSCGISGWTGSAEDAAELVRINAQRTKAFCPPIRMPDPQRYIGLVEPSYTQEVTVARVAGYLTGVDRVPGDPRVDGRPMSVFSIWPDDGRPSFVDGAFPILSHELEGMIAGHENHAASFAGLS